MNACKGKGLSRIDALALVVINREKGNKANTKFCSRCNLFHVVVISPPRS